MCKIVTKTKFEIFSWKYSIRRSIIRMAQILTPHHESLWFSLVGDAVRFGEFLKNGNHFGLKRVWGRRTLHWASRSRFSISGVFGSSSGRGGSLMLPSHSDIRFFRAGTRSKALFRIGFRLQNVHAGNFTLPWLIWKKILEIKYYDPKKFWQHIHNNRSGTVVFPAVLFYSRK